MENNVEKKQIKKSEIIAMREAGKTRKEIAEHYGVVEAKMIKVYKTFDIKGRPKAKPSFELELIDDTIENNKEEFSSDPEVILRELKKEHNQ